MAARFFTFTALLFFVGASNAQLEACNTSFVSDINLGCLYFHNSDLPNPPQAQPLPPGIQSLDHGTFLDYIGDRISNGSFLMFHILAAANNIDDVVFNGNDEQGIFCDKQTTIAIDSFNGYEFNKTENFDVWSCNITAPQDNVLKYYFEAASGFNSISLIYNSTLQTVLGQRLQAGQPNESDRYALSLDDEPVDPTTSDTTSQSETSSNTDTSSTTQDVEPTSSSSSSSSSSSPDTTNDTVSSNTQETDSSAFLGKPLATLLLFTCHLILFN